MKTVIVINGKPRAGKDTAVDFMRDELAKHDVPTWAFSSIDPVKQMIEDAGIDISKKTEADRKLLSVVGDALQEHSEFRTTVSLQHIDDFFVNHSDGVFFLHIREPHLIAKVREACQADGIRFISILLLSVHAQDVTSNVSDAGVAQGRYTWTMINNGTLEEFEQTCRDLVRDQLLP